MQTKSERSLRSAEILKIAIPAVLETLFTTFAAMIDSKMVSSMGITAISAVSLTNNPRLFIMCAFTSLCIVASSLTARNIGKKDRDGANRVLATTLVFTTLMAVVLSALAVIFAPQIMTLCNGQPDTLADSIDYFRIVMGGLIFNVEFMSINAVMRGCGKTTITFISNALSCVINLFTNYLLIDGHLGFPALKIKGAAIATIFGNFVAMVLCFIVAFSPKFYSNLTYCIKNRIRATIAQFKEIFNMWNKTLLNDLFCRLGFLLISIMIAKLGSFVTSVYSIGMHLLNVNFAVGYGFQTAAVALLGRSYGAKDRQSIHDYYRQIIITGLITGVVMGFLIVALGRPYFGFFNTDPEFIRIGALSCIMIGVVCPLQTVQIIMVGSLQGLGEMKYAMTSGIVSVTLVNTLTVYLVSIVLNFGIWGVWSGVITSNIIRVYLSNRKLRIITKADEVHHE